MSSYLIHIIQYAKNEAFKSVYLYMHIRMYVSVGYEMECVLNHSCFHHEGA